jgi:hypothetical protein
VHADDIDNMFNSMVLLRGILLCALTHCTALAASAAGEMHMSAGHVAMQHMHIALDGSRIFLNVLCYNEAALQQQ